MASYRTKVTDDEIAKALEENEYNVYAASRALRFARPANLKRRIQNTPSLKEMIEGKPQFEIKKKREITDEEFIEVIYRAKGIKNIIAKILGIHISNVYNRVNTNPALQQHIRLASEEFKDVAEMKLFELVEQGDFDAIKFYLSHQARDRGYGDKVEFEATLNMNNNWNLKVLGVEELLMLEALAQKALPEGDRKDVIEARFVEIPTESNSD